MARRALLIVSRLADLGPGLASCTKWEVARAGRGSSPHSALHPGASVWPGEASARQWRRARAATVDSERAARACVVISCRDSCDHRGLAKAIGFAL
mgnify:CR=1 FL=1